MASTATAGSTRTYGCSVSVEQQDRGCHPAYPAALRMTSMRNDYRCAYTFKTPIRHTASSSSVPESLDVGVWNCATAHQNYKLALKKSLKSLSPFFSPGKRISLFAPQLLCYNLRVELGGKMKICHLLKISRICNLLLGPLKSQCRLTVVTAYLHSSNSSPHQSVSGHPHHRHFANIVKRQICATQLLLTNHRIRW